MVKLRQSRPPEEVCSVIAKGVLEGSSFDVPSQEPWFDLGSQISTGCCMEVPQLWNDRCFSEIRMENGEVVTSEKLRDAKVHGVYGGVDFGIDRFRLAAPSRVATSVVAGRAALGRPASTLMATSQARGSVGCGGGSGRMLEARCLSGCVCVFTACGRTEGRSLKPGVHTKRVVHWRGGR